MVGCCEVALVSSICGVIGLAIYAGYTVKMKDRQIELEKQNREIKKELAEVERVNGKEKQDIKDLQQEVKKLKAQLENHE